MNDNLSQRVNPIKRKHIHKNIHLNSKFRDDYYNTSSSNFKYTFSNNLEKVISLKLTSISIPNSWYLFSEERGNNKFTVTITDTSSTIIDVMIPEGNYTASQLEGYLNDTYFWNSSTDLKFIKFGININTMKTYFDVSKNSVNGANINNDTKFDISFVDENTENLMFNAGWVLGFRHGKYLNLKDINCVSEGLFDGGGDRYLYLCLKDYNNNVSNSNIVYFDDTTMRHDVLAKIYLIDGKFAINFDTDIGINYSRTREYFGPITFEKFEIQLVDQYGKQIDLNNMDFSFSLELKQIYNNF